MPVNAAETDGADTALVLGERYHELMAYRAEALAKYRTALGRLRPGPPFELAFPKPRVGPSELYTRVRLGVLAVDDVLPIYRIFDRWIDSKPGPLRVLELGPGRGALADHAQRYQSEKIADYVGIDRDPHVAGAYRRIKDVGEVSGPVDLLVGIEVAEHMSAQALVDEYLVPLRTKLSADASCILSVPNALGPAGINRDFTHVQIYPWYDLYALLRLEFERVDIWRTYYAHSLGKIALLPLRQVVCAALELDWCDGVLGIASIPKRRWHGSDERNELPQTAS